MEALKEDKLFDSFGDVINLKILGPVIIFRSHDGGVYRLEMSEDRKKLSGMLDRTRIERFVGDALGANHAVLKADCE